MGILFALLFVIALGYVALMGFKINHEEKEKAREAAEVLSSFIAGDRIVLIADNFGYDIIVRKGTKGVFVAYDHSCRDSDFTIIVSLDGFPFELRIPACQVEKEK